MSRESKNQSPSALTPLVLDTSKIRADVEAEIAQNNVLAADEVRFRQSIRGDGPNQNASLLEIAMGNLEGLLSEDIGNISFDINYIDQRLKAIVAAQDAVVVALQYERL